MWGGGGVSSLGSRGKRNWRCQSWCSVVRQSSNKASQGAKVRNPTHTHTHTQELASEILHNGCSRATASRCLFVKAQVRAAGLHHSCFKNATWLTRYMTLIRLSNIFTGQGKGKDKKRQIVGDHTTKASRVTWVKLYILLTPASCPGLFNPIGTNPPSRPLSIKLGKAYVRSFTV